MFSAKDFKVFEMPFDWERNDLLGDVFFPKLGALLAKINTLIYQIYGIDTSLRYNISSTPTTSLRPCGWDNKQRRAKKYNLKSNNPYDVLVGLRGRRGEADILLRSGSRTKNHFALFGVVIGDWDYVEKGYGINLAIEFMPYVYFRYDQSVRDKFVSLAEDHSLFRLATYSSEGDYMVCGHFEDFDTSDMTLLCRTFLTDQTQIVFNRLNPLSISREDLASLVISGAGAFPLMDSFTRMCSNENIVHDYNSLFKNWFESKKKQEYIDNFYIEELSEEVIWKSEQETRAIFESLLKSDFKKVRPNWLKTSKGKRLELDGFNEKLKLAFEYQGEYHYMDIPIHHQQRTLKEVQKNDEIKRNLCKKYSIDLIEVPYWEKGNIKYIVESLKSLNRTDINLLINLENL